MEEWKPIPGYEGIYDASNYGRIRTTPGKTTTSVLHGTRCWKSRILKEKHPCNTKRQDKRVTLWKDKVPKDYLVARLVASAWHGVPGQGMTVNHINGDWNDNRPENLEWVTLSENVRKAFDAGLCSSFMKKVVLVDEFGKEVQFNSMSAASRYLNRYDGYLSQVVIRGHKATSKEGSRFSVRLV